VATNRVVVVLVEVTSSKKSKDKWFQIGSGWCHFRWDELWQEWSSRK